MARTKPPIDEANLRFMVRHLRTADEVDTNIRKWLADVFDPDSDSEFRAELVRRADYRPPSSTTEFKFRQIQMRIAFEVRRVLNEAANSDGASRRKMIKVAELEVAKKLGIGVATVHKAWSVYLKYMETGEDTAAHQAFSALAHAAEHGEYPKWEKK